MLIEAGYECTECSKCANKAWELKRIVWIVEDNQSDVVAGGRSVETYSDI